MCAGQWEVAVGCCGSDWRWRLGAEAAFQYPGDPLGGTVGYFRGAQRAVLVGLGFFFSRVERHTVGFVWMCFQSSRRENLSFKYYHAIYKKKQLWLWSPSSSSSSTGWETVLCRSCCWSRLVQPSHPSSIVSLCSTLRQRGSQMNFALGEKCFRVVYFKPPAC